MPQSIMLLIGDQNYIPLQIESKQKGLVSSIDDSLNPFLIGVGRRAEVLLAKNTVDQRTCLIKLIKTSVIPEDETTVIEAISEAFYEDGLNYIMAQVTQTLSCEINQKKFDCQIFPRVEGRSLTRGIYKSAWNDLESLYKILIAYKRFLECIKKINDVGYLHCDIHEGNIYEIALTNKEDLFWFPIDFDRSRKSSVLLQSAEQQTLKLTDLPDINHNFDEFLNGQETPSQYVNILDTAPVAILLKNILCFDASSEKSLLKKKHPELYWKLYDIISKGTDEDYSERYQNAQGMINDLVPILDAMSRTIPISARALKDIELDHGKTIQQLKISYRSAHGLSSSEDIDITYKDLLKEISTDILPWLEYEKHAEPDRPLYASLKDLLDQTERDNLVLIGTAGAGKSTALLYYYLNQFASDDTLCIYLPCKHMDTRLYGSWLEYLYQRIGHSLADIKFDGTLIDILIDGFDELGSRNDTQDHASFDETFLKELETIKKSTNHKIRFVITSRFRLSCKNQDNLQYVNVQALTTTQIENYLGKLYFDQAAEKHALMNLLINPFCLTLFRALKTMNNDGVVYHISNESELIGQFLREMYMKKAPEGKRQDLFFERYIHIIVENVSAGQNICINRETLTDLYDFMNIFNHYIGVEQIPIEDIKVYNCYINSAKIEDSLYEMVFKHDLFKQYFIGYGLKRCFSAISTKHELYASNIEFLDRAFSFETLMMFAQMILCSRDQSYNQSNKAVLEHLCGCFRKLLSIDFYTDQVKGNERNLDKSVSLFDQIIEEEIIVDQIREGMIGCFEKNIINIVAFAYDGDLSQFSFGKTITSIPARAFENCPILRKIVVPGYFKKIEEKAFAKCSSLEKVVLKDGIENIEPGVFYQCNKLAEIKIPDTVIKIGEIEEGFLGSMGAFCACVNLSHITLSKNLKIIGSNSFSLCKKLVEISIPETVSQIGTLAFSEAGLIKLEIFGHNLTTIHDGICFSCVNLKKVFLPSTVKEIGTLCFANCPSLQEILVDLNNPYFESIGNCLIDTKYKVLLRGCSNSTIPNDYQVECIDYSAFSCSQKLVYIQIPEGITHILDEGFCQCTHLETIILPSTLKTIGHQCFDGCVALKSITIPENVDEIAEEDAAGIWGSILSDCKSLEEIIVHPQNTTYHSAGNCLIKTVSKKILAGSHNSTIPADGSVEEIGAFAFCGRSNLETIELPATITSIGNFAFYNCTNLKKILLPHKIKHIAYGVFWGCSNLSKIDIPSNIKTIGNLAFCECRNLEKVLLYKGLETIEEEAFMECTKLQSFEMPIGLKRIEERVFKGCESIEKISIPNTVEYIGEDFLTDCPNLKEIIYTGTVSEWRNYIEKQFDNAEFSKQFPAPIYCQDGIIVY